MWPLHLLRPNQTDSWEALSWNLGMPFYKLKEVIIRQLLILYIKLVLKMEYNQAPDYQSHSAETNCNQASDYLSVGCGNAIICKRLDFWATCRKIFIADTRFESYNTSLANATPSQFKI